MSKKLKLNNLSKREFEKVRGGRVKVDICMWYDSCGCGCMYEGQPGGSSSGDNMVANHDGGGLQSPNC